MPPEVEEIIDVIGNRVRQAIIRELAHHGPAQTAHLQQTTSASRDATVKHLRHLEQLGIVEADVESSRRRGRTVTWSLKPDAVAWYLDGLRAYLLGS